MRSSHTVFVWLVRLLGVSAIVLAYSFFLGPYGLPGLRSLRSQVADRSDRVHERILANAALEARLEALKNDPRALETELRTSQNWVRPGEVMIVVPDSDTATTSR
ncbi:MAG TPA: septum formation initiator family protein [Candidatus Binatia bacterium]|nr:septum formation initiator family protein [Candidatus Binatia bacterium]